MGDVLSQSEIDSLLASLAGGDEPSGLPAATSKKEARLYDFEHPSKFSKEQLRTLENIFEVFARNVSSFLTGYLRTAVHLEVASSEQLLYKDFNLSLMNPVVLAMTEWTPLNGTVVMELSNNMGYTVIDLVLGGPGFGLKNIRDFAVRYSKASLKSNVLVSLCLRRNFIFRKLNNITRVGVGVVFAINNYRVVRCAGAMPFIA